MFDLYLARLLILGGRICDYISKQVVDTIFLIFFISRISLLLEKDGSVEEVSEGDPGIAGLLFNTSVVNVLLVSSPCHIVMWLVAYLVNIDRVMSSLHVAVVESEMRYDFVFLSNIRALINKRCDVVSYQLSLLAKWSAFRLI